MRRDVKDGAIIGGVIGVLVWLYDFRYIITGGRPETPVADALCDSLVAGPGSIVDKVCTFGLEGANVLCAYLLPFLILTTAGVVTGAALARLIRAIRKVPAPES
jgi:hypothetical protein